MSRILVIDDEKNIRKMVRLALERAGHVVQAAEDGTRGLELFSDGTGWDLVLTDQRMPGPQGREVVREVRRRDSSARLVMMTAFATAELASEVLQDGATDFLRKPFAAETLRDAINAALARPRQKSVAILEEAEKIVGGTFDGLSPRPAAMSPISFYLNGFTFWPVQASEEERQAVQNLNIYRVFQVRAPDGKSGRCVVGVTPHIEASIHAKSGQDEGDFLWELICRTSLINYLWDKAEMPAVMLPVYEFSGRQLEDIRRLSKTDDHDDA